MASDGSDNPILDMGLLNMMQPNKYIDPKFAGKPLDLPGFYTGNAGAQGPTDAAGKPIQSFVDANTAKQKTYQDQLSAYNSQPQPQQPSFDPNRDLENQWLAQNKQPLLPANPTPPAGTTTLNSVGSGTGLDAGLGAMGMTQIGQQMAAKGMSPQDIATMVGLPGAQNILGQQPQQAAAAPAGPSPPNLRQDYLDALSAPQGYGGKMAMPGATVPQSQPLGVPSVMNAFLSAHPSGGSKGAGNYDNSGFFNTLSNLRNA